MKRQWFYRGSLKSCNYQCSYCPFSKKKGGARERELDKKALFRFVERINDLNGAKGAVMIVPYGEALIHDYYWEALAALSANPKIEAVGAQSNFSFSIEQMTSHYDRHGGDLKKLRLWGTFHPEMTTVNNFAKQCSELSKRKIAYCVGAVGAPSCLERIRQLREALPKDAYLWINKMDGMKGGYTKSEIEAFLEIDAYFETELSHIRADGASCGSQIFVEADGTMRRCNLSRSSIGNLYEQDSLPINAADQKDLSIFYSQDKNNYCTRTECSCFLAYCNRKEEQLLFFQPYPAFRMPSYPKAMFIDVDGTLIPQGERHIPTRYVRWLRRLSNHTELYLATSLPYECAKRKTKEIWPFLSGGVFANGARVIINQPIGLDEIAPMDGEWFSLAEQMQKECGYRLHLYRKGSFIYKATCSFQKRRLPRQMTGSMLDEFRIKLKIPDSCQIWQEDNCIQITKKGCKKREGALKICDEKGYAKDEVAVIGNAENDCQMLEAFSFSVAVKGSLDSVKDCASFTF